MNCPSAIKSWMQTSWLKILKYVNICNMVFLFSSEEWCAEKVGKPSSIDFAKMLCKYEQFSSPAHMKFIVNMLSYMTYTMLS
jgi:hypothetical protein